MNNKKTNDKSTPPNLPCAAASAWQAYQEMGHTKQNHLDYLRYLEDKYQKYGQPTSTEAHHLTTLLEKHDNQVTLFKTSLQKLKQTDHNAHKAFIKYLADVPRSKG
jgi:hypothetical protein